MAQFLLAVACAACVSVADAKPPHIPLPSARSPWRRAEAVALERGVIPGVRHPSYAYTWEDRYFPNNVDQFNYVGAASAATFPQRYLINTDSWGGPGFPIFFYAGNEGAIELFANNTGWLWELAPQYKACVVFAEHRYYGLSMPFGNASYTLPNLAFLSIEQALADYANLLFSLKGNLSAQASPVVTFGGSYGGMLAAWFRTRYPHVTVGSIASSAPILQIPGVMDPHAYSAIITRDFAAVNPLAPQVVFNAFNTMIALGASQPGRDTVQTSLRICDLLTSQDDVWNAVGYLSGALGFLAMADYPYPSSFLGPLPASPVAVVAALLTDPSAPPPALLAQIAAGPLAVFYNYSGQAGACFNLTQSSPPGLEGDGWDVQCCREVVQPIGQYGLPNDMFYVAPFSEQAFVQGCQEQYGGLTPRPNQQLLFYGASELRGASNLFLASGSLDPWLSGDVVLNSSFTTDVTVFVMEGAAHHLDLRASNAADPPAVVQARALQRAAISRWVAEHYAGIHRPELMEVLGLGAALEQVRERRREVSPHA